MAVLSYECETTPGVDRLSKTPVLFSVTVAEATRGDPPSAPSFLWAALPTAMPLNTIKYLYFFNLFFTSGEKFQL